MAAASETIQTIARLTPLADVLAMVDLDVKPVTPRTVELTAAAGRTLAVDAMAPSRPSSALAMLDGWALAADETLGAGGYSPALLARDAAARRGRPADAARHRQRGAVRRGEDVAVAAPKRWSPSIRATASCRRAAIATRPFRCGAPASVCAPPISPLSPLPVSRASPCASRAFACCRCAAAASSTPPRGWWRAISNAAAARLRLDDAGRDFGVVLAAESADAIVAIGGTGSGRNDNSVQTLAREGRLAVHGIALTPGETAALGFVGHAPGADAAGTARRGARRLADGGAAHAGAAGRHQHNKESEPVETLPLARKVTSTVGLGRSRAGAAQRRPGRAAGDEISAAVVAGALRRLDPGAGRQRGLFRRLDGAGKAVAMRNRRHE